MSCGLEMCGNLLPSTFVEAEEELRLESLSTEMDSWAELREQWFALESPSAQLARCTLLSDFVLEMTDLDNVDSPLPKLLQATSAKIGLSSPTGMGLASSEQSHIVTPINESRRLSSDFYPQHRTTDSCPFLLQSSPPMATTFVDKFVVSTDLLLTGSADKQATMEDCLGEHFNGRSFPGTEVGPFAMGFKAAKKVQPIFSHWNRQADPAKTISRMSTVPSISSFPKLRRSTTEFNVMTIERDTVSPASGEISTLLRSNIGTDHVLPCFDSPRDAIKRICPSIMTKVLTGQYDHAYSKLIIVDCRYPYEYHGGHLPGAINVCSLEVIDQVLFTEELCRPDFSSESTVVIFHCEFSSERAPRMALHVRNTDRVLNSNNYPHLHFPQLYILDGGYKNFYLQFPENCEPPCSYVPMRNMGHRDELRHHQRLKFHDENSHGKHRHKLRSCSLRKSHSIAMPHPVTAISTFFKARESVPASPNLSSFKVTNTIVDLLSSDIGDIYDQAESILEAAESVLLSGSVETGRISK